MYTDRIYFTGFMTCGKSTIGPILANVLGWNFFDLDLEIIKNEGMSIKEIFDKKGEEYFRQIEGDILFELSKHDKTIISLGGGAITNERNLQTIKSSGKLIYLKITPEVIYYRIKNKLNRPIFYDLVMNEAPKEAFLNKINSLLEEREKYYNQADLVIETGNNEIGVTVDKIAKILWRLGIESN